MPAKEEAAEGKPGKKVEEAERRDSEKQTFRSKNSQNFFSCTCGSKL